MAKNSELKTPNNKELEVTILKTDIGGKNGQDKCPKCGATDISLNIKNGKLRCHYCRYEFESEIASNVDTDVNDLKGQVFGSGAQDIDADTSDILTLKCTSCGAEVVIDTNEVKQARCHWCRHILSINSQIPNGAIPDMVLPFKMSKEEAELEIQKFVSKRNFFANPKFKKEFTTENIMGVYFPYMVVDANTHVHLVGEGEHLVRRYTRKVGDNTRTYYDADLYHIERDFDLTIEDLTIESNLERLKNNSESKTNNVINAIMPFDIENCVKWNANYLKGYSSEKRDTNIEMLRPLVETQARDIARFAANDTLEYYDRGVSWENESLDIKGEQWKAAYLPVWLYSYQQIKGNKSVLHYVAVNARTKETMGSVPVHLPKLWFVSFIVEMFALMAMLFIDFEYNWLFLMAGFIYFWIIYSRYRNSNARHMHELETKKKMSNLVNVDNHIKRRTGLSSSRMVGANNRSVDGKSNQVDVLKVLVGEDNIIDK